ncbi:MAG: metallophosphatase family protein [Thermoanaerobaculia bacterium]|nr:metallophosphatase family protein [Thermoanaerobaculia bacterium]
MRIGLLADVHGNRWALDAVLEDAAGRSIDRWVNAGDCFYGPLDPLEAPPTGCGPSAPRP